MEQQRLGGDYEDVFSSRLADEEDESICECGHWEEDHIDYTGQCCYCECDSYKEESE